MVTSVKARCLSCDRRAVLDERKLKSKRPPICRLCGGSTWRIVMEVTCYSSCRPYPHRAGSVGCILDRSGSTIVVELPGVPDDFPF
ncbi:zinc-ribbon containing domain [Pseudomonas phage E2005-C]|nr:zinc-ribbon containing domain [Pseudomonas phage E2005-C]